MTDWSDGYVVDVDYMPGFYSHQVPSHIDLACLARGFVPAVEQGAPFSYCELGCGLGETASIIAAAVPEADVWAFDFSPSQIDEARRDARAGGLANIRFEERSFEQLALGDTRGIPVFDYIALHGVWTWISAENRSHIVRFIDRHLRPGGVAYVTYNVLPNWAPTVPLQRLLFEAARNHPDRTSEKRIGEAIAVAEAFAEASPYMDQKGLAVARRLLDAGKAQYLAHEHLNAHWNPAFQRDVAGALSAAKLGYVASANIVENFPHLILQPAQRELLDRLPPDARETGADYFQERTFRRDIYVRGPRRLKPGQLEAVADRTRLTLCVPKGAVTCKLKIPLGEATLLERFYAPAFAALAEGRRSVAELRALPGLEGPLPARDEIVGLMSASNQVRPVPYEPGETTLERVRGYNLSRVLRAASEGLAMTTIAGAATGSGVQIGLTEMLAYEAFGQDVPHEARPLGEAMTDILFSRGSRLRDKDRQIEDRDETVAILCNEGADILRDSLPMWRHQGAI